MTASASGSARPMVAQALAGEAEADLQSDDQERGDPDGGGHLRAPPEAAQVDRGRQQQRPQQGGDRQPQPAPDDEPDQAAADGEQQADQPARPLPAAPEPLPGDARRGRWRRPA